MDPNLRLPGHRCAAAEPGHRRKSRDLWGLPVLALLLEVACTHPATLTELESEVFQPNCVFSGCHQTGSNEGGLTLDTDVYAHLVNAPSVDAPGKIRVVPGDLGASYLYEKVTQDQPTFGDRMPPGSPLNGADLELIQSWILDGAPDN